jgi:hypothetical protein
MADQASAWVLPLSYFTPALLPADAICLDDTACVQQCWILLFHDLYIILTV